MPKLNKDGTIKVTEDDIEDMTILAFEIAAWHVVRTHLKGQYRPVHLGIADIHVEKYAYNAWIECKKPTWKPKPFGQQSPTEMAQIAFRDRVLAHGGRYVIIQNEEELHQDLKILNEEALKWGKMRGKS